MDKIDWKRKLTSRKFWMAVIGFIGPLLIAFGMSEEQSAQVTSLIMSGATVIAYLIAEGLTDAAGVEGSKGTPGFLSALGTICVIVLGVAIAYLAFNAYMRNRIRARRRKRRAQRRRNN